MKKILAILLALTMLLALVACQKAEEPAAETEPEAPAAATEPAAETEPEAPAAATEPEAETEPEAPAAEGMQRIIVWNNAVLELTASEQKRGEGDMRNAYAIKDVYEACGIQGQDACQVIGSDGYAADEKLEDLMQKYVTLEGESAPILVGEAQDPELAVWEVAYISFGTEAVMFSYKDKISVKDMFEALGMAEAESYDFICTDGYTQNVPAADIAECYVSWIEDRVDAEVPGIGDYTLYNILYIQPAA